MDKELEEQMRMLEGLTLEEKPLSSHVLEKSSDTVVPVETADTLLGNVPFGTVTQPVGKPSGISNPMSGIDMATPVTQTVQNNQVPGHQMYNQPYQPIGVAEPKTVSPAPAIDMNAAPVFVNLAASTYQTKTDFLSLKDGEKTRVTLVNLNFIRNHVHFIEGLGKFRCLSQYDEANRWPVNRAICCQFPKKEDPTKYENAKNRLLVPVIEYPVSKTDGKTPIAGSNPKLKMWDMNYVEEKQLLSILEEYKSGEDWGSIDTTAFDLSLTKGKNGEFSTITLVAVPSWRNNFIAGINAEIAKVNQEFYQDAYKESARVISEDTIQKHLISKQQENALAQQLANQQFPAINNIDLGV